MLLKKVARYLKMFCVYITALEVLLPLPTISCFVSFFSFIFNHLLMAFESIGQTPLWLLLKWVAIPCLVCSHINHLKKICGSSSLHILSSLYLSLILTAPVPHSHCTCSYSSLHLFLLLTAPATHPCRFSSSLHLPLYHFITGVSVSMVTYVNHRHRAIYSHPSGYNLLTIIHF